MTHTQQLCSFLDLVLAFSLYDRFCGGGLFWKMGIFTRGRPIYYVVLMLGVDVAVDAWLSPHLMLWPVAVGWLIWRWPGWKLFGGSLNPQTLPEIGGTFARHSLILAVPALYALAGRLDMALELLPWLALFPVSATALGVLNGDEAKVGRDVNWFVELMRGAIFGGLVAQVLVAGT
jgi:hypothetical protein